MWQEKKNKERKRKRRRCNGRRLKKRRTREFVRQLPVIVKAEKRRGGEVDQEKKTLLYPIIVISDTSA